LILDGDYSSTVFNVTADHNGGIDVSAGPSNAATIASGATLEVSEAASEKLTFEGPTGSLKLDNPESFGGEIAGFAEKSSSAEYSETIDLVRINHEVAAFAETYNPSSGILTVTDGLHNATFKFDSFNGTLNFVSDHHGGTLITGSPLAEQQSIGAMSNASSDQFDFKAAAGTAGDGRVENFKTIHSEFDSDHSAVSSNDTASSSARFWSFGANSGKDQRDDLSSLEHRFGHDHVAAGTLSPSSSHANDYVLPYH
jgi:hypothetical protein